MKTPSPAVRPTIKDVARAAGVSKALVSIVFRGAPGASDETRAKVFAVADQLGYRADRTAALLASRRSKHLGVTVTLHNAFQAEVVEHIQAAADEAGYQVVLGTVTRSHGERRAVETLLDFRCEAAVLLGPELGEPELEILAGQIPVVTIGRRLRRTGIDQAQAPRLDTVRSADDVGLELVIDHLVGLGHRRIAHIDGGNTPIADDRRRGFASAMARHRLRSRAVTLPGGNQEADGWRAAEALLTRKLLPTAVTCFNDHCALGVLDRLSRAGIGVPDQVSVTGYDDSMVAQLGAVNLTSVSQEAEAQARWAVAAAVGWLEGRRTEPRESVLPPRLVVRGTTGPVTDTS